MSALAIARPRAERLVYTTFEAWLVRSIKWHDAKPELIGDFGEDRDAAIRAGAMAAGHKGFFVLRSVNHFAGTSMLSFYRVKRSTKRFVTREAYDGGRPVREGALEAEHLFDLAGGAL